MGGRDWDLDALVGKVMADLRNGRVAENETAAARLSAALSSDFKAIRAAQTSGGDGKPSREDDADAKKDKADGAEFVVAEKLLVAETVRRLAASTCEKRWKVRPDLIATPAAKDELRKLGVELVVGAGGTEKVGKSPRVTYSASNVFDFLEADTAFSSAKGRSGVLKKKTPAASSRLFWAVHLPDGARFPNFIENNPFRAVAYAQSRLACLKETTKRVAAEIAQNKETRAIITTRDAAIASIWANRFSGVRAVVAFFLDQTKRDIEATNANVLIVDPSEVGPFSFRKIVEFFATRESQ